MNFKSKPAQAEAAGAALDGPGASFGDDALATRALAELKLLDPIHRSRFVWVGSLGMTRPASASHFRAPMRILRV